MKSLNAAFAVSLAVLATLIAPTTAAARPDCEVAARIAARAEAGFYDSQYQLAETIHRTGPEAMLSSQLGWKALWRMDETELEKVVDFNAYCRKNMAELVPDASEATRAHFRDQLRTGTPALVEWHARAREIVARRAAIRQRVDALIRTPFEPAQGRAWLDAAREINAARRELSAPFTASQVVRILHAMDAAARADIETMAAADPQGLDAYRDLHAELAGWLEIQRLHEMPAYDLYVGGRWDARDLPQPRAANSFAKLREQAAQAHAQALLAPTAEADLYPRDQAAQRLLQADYAEAKALDPAYHETLLASLRTAAAARRKALENHLCDTGMDTAGADQDQLWVDVAGTEAHPTVSLAVIVCSIAQNGVEVTYTENDGWFDGDGFMLTLTPRYDTVNFVDAAPFETLKLTFEPVPAAGEDVYSAVRAERDGTAEDLDLPAWRALLARLDGMHVGTPDAS
ncbi:hypothetical protein CKO28_00775 [Rhodovibrio sodomensis]|uniref:DUF4034 domain-containing protein n=1 Tax=Rhodovibrio sodomensis TaxID=1088 RepID=A0ABS1DAX5_9PROT|nr:hypothetical protein [Rhodovibrio sodomensis]MBK1666575.1 hypothetical protein [Rhodovibrio sodomensis]